jgi:hypothetical protein
MSDLPANNPTIDPQTAPNADREPETTEVAPVAAGRLDSPIEKIDLGTSDTFIPEAVDQLLAHSRRYPLLTPAQEIELAQRIERGDLHAKELLVNSNLRLVASNAPREREVRLAQGLPLLDLRNAVDPSGDPARPRELGTDDPPARARRAALPQGRARRARAVGQART